MTEEFIKESISNYQRVLKKAAEVASEWIKYEEIGYSFHSISDIDFAKGVVTCQAAPYSSGCFKTTSFPLRYLWCQDGLQEAAKTQYAEYIEERNKIHKQLSELTKNKYEAETLENRLRTMRPGNVTGSPCSRYGFVF